MISKIFVFLGHFRDAVMPQPSNKGIAALAGSVMTFLSGCSGPPVIKTPSPIRATSRPYVIKNKVYVPQKHYELMQTGIASYYGGRDGCHGSRTANGERFNMFQLSAAHKTLPLPSMVMVENLENGRKLVLRVNDRGPFASNRILDVSVAAARRLGFYHTGCAKVRLYTLVRDSLCLPENQPGFCKKSIKGQEIGNLSLRRYYIQVPCKDKHKLFSMKKSLTPWGRTHIKKMGNRCGVWIGPYSTQWSALQVSQRIPKVYGQTIVCQQNASSRVGLGKKPQKRKRKIRKPSSQSSRSGG